MTESFYRDQPAFSGFTYSPGVFDAFRRADASGKAIFTRLMAAHLEWFTAEVGGMFEKADYYREDTLRALRLHGDSGVLGIGCPEYGIRGGWTRIPQALYDGSRIGFLRRSVFGPDQCGLEAYGTPSGAILCDSTPVERPAAASPGRGTATGRPAVAAASKQGGLGFYAGSRKAVSRTTRDANRALGQVHVSATSRLKAAESATQRLAIIDETIAATERVRTAAPWCAGCYQLIGIMEHERAVLLVTQKSLRAACEAIAPAASYAGPRQL